MLGFEFANNYEPYSIFNLLQAVGAASFLLIEALVDNKTKYLAYTICLAALGIVSCGLTYFFKFKHVQSPRQMRKKIKVINNSVTTMESSARLIDENNF